MFRKNSSLQILESLYYTRTFLHFSCGNCGWTRNLSSIKRETFDSSRHKVFTWYLNVALFHFILLVSLVTIFVICYLSCRIHCTHAAGYNIKEANRSSSQKTEDDKIILVNFKVNGAESGVLGRCFIEVKLYLTIKFKIWIEFWIIDIFCVHRLKMVSEGPVFQ